GLREGITQIARSSVSRQLFISHADISKTCVWNFPIEITFKSHNPYGWPQIVFSLYGLDEFGRDVVRGYGAARVPVVPGRHTLYVDVYTPVATSPFNELLSWIRGKAPEFLDPTFVTKNSSREVTRVRSQGTVKLKLNVIVKDFDQLGYSSC
ncbi:B9 domain-containing protein, partial [Cladochytrium replicatum]